jgi:hypothetical protein
MNVFQLIENARNNAGVVKDATRAKNLAVLKTMLGPAMRGFLLQTGKQSDRTDMPASHNAHFDWQYRRGHNELERLYEVAKTSQWNGTTDLDWSIEVDPHDEARDLFPEQLLPLPDFATYRRLPTKEQQLHRHALLAWMLSQFLHGEQAALFAACQVTEAVQWLDGKLYGSSQVVDEGRHVEVFHRYLTTKLEKLYVINDNLYVLVDALLRDSRWDIKFLGMQIMIEGLALGAFGTMRAATKEPLLKEMLRYVITDEARHVHFGVVALRDHYASLPEKDRREREDWAYEVAVLMRNRFLAHEFYDEYYGHVMSRKAWDRTILESRYMEHFRQMMFKRLIPNLKRIGLLSDRIRPHYADLGLLQWETEKAAPDLTAEELIRDSEEVRLTA